MGEWRRLGLAWVQVDSAEGRGRLAHTRAAQGPHTQHRSRYCTEEGVTCKVTTQSLCKTARIIGVFFFTTVSFFKCKSSHVVFVSSVFCAGYYMVPGYPLSPGQTSEILSGTLLPSTKCTVGFCICFCIICYQCCHQPV